MSPHVRIRMEKVKEFCSQWKIVKFSLFGSVLRKDFGPDSDIDVLVAFGAGSQWDLFDLVEMREGLKEILGREVDLVEEGTIRNPFRRHAIMTTREVLYAT